MRHQLGHFRLSKRIEERRNNNEPERQGIKFSAEHVEILFKI